jgi:tetratricopeptide (TPR) repeat protein
MNKSFETTFITQTFEKKPFEATPAQNFFTKWCEINDSIVPKFISREDWQQRGIQSILEKNDQGKQTLFLPKDLHLWEMMDIIKTVDHDTFSWNYEKREKKANQIQTLGVIFEKAGVYLSEYLPSINEDNGKSIAEDIAHKFYEYGLSLQAKERKTTDIPEKLSLTKEDKTKLDEWFLGRDAYQKRFARLGNNPSEDQIEDTRKSLLQVYFNALGREGYKGNKEKLWETKVGPMQYLQDKTRNQITKEFETPEREMKTTIFIRGMEKLVTEMKEVGWKKAINSFLKIIGLDQILEQRKLYDTLQIDKLKQELEDIRKTENIAKISAKELEIAKKIQKKVSSFPYKSTNNGSGAEHPSTMIETQFINCVGASILGGGLLDKVGIKYLPARLPNHAATVLITSDGKVRWQEFTPWWAMWNYKHIQDKDITGKNKDGQTLTVSDIVAFANNPRDGDIRFEINRWWYNLNMLEVNIPNRYIYLGNPENNLQSFILSNTGNSLREIGRYEEAIEAYKQTISIDPKFEDTIYNLGLLYKKMNQYENAIETFTRHNEIINNPNNEWVKRAKKMIIEMKS